MKIFAIFYFIVVGLTLGATIYAGAVVAPVTFNTDVLFGSQLLNQFQEGMIMAKNFLRLSYALIVSAIVIALYEILKLKNGTKDIYSIVPATIVIITSLLFAFYFVPEIIQMQSLGESMTQSNTFNSIHKASETNVKILVFAQLFLFVLNLYRNLK